MPPKQKQVAESRRDRAATGKKRKNEGAKKKGKKSKKEVQSSPAATSTPTLHMSADGEDIEVARAVDSSDDEPPRIHPVNRFRHRQPEDKLVLTAKERASIAKFVQDHPILYDREIDGWNSAEARLDVMQEWADDHNHDGTNLTYNITQLSE